MGVTLSAIRGAVPPPPPKTIELTRPTVPPPSKGASSQEGR